LNGAVAAAQFAEQDVPIVHVHELLIDEHSVAPPPGIREHFVADRAAQAVV
jgi:hypothetical protein